MNGTITRRMQSVFGGLENEFEALYDKTDFKRKIKKLETVGNQSNRASVLKELFKMMDACSISYEKGRDNEYYKELLKNSVLPTYSNLEDKMICALYNIYGEYPSPEEYIKRIVDHLESEEDGWVNDTLRLRILKQFVKYGNYLSDAEFGGKSAISAYVKNKLGKNKPVSDDEVLHYVDDDVFKLLEGANKAQRKYTGKYGLLKTADDLANGKFRTEGGTKKTLYMFAMVYGMTYFTNDTEDGELPYYDIEAKLFRDYYTNNLMRYITNAYRDRLSDYETNPSGQGINYKNFAEVVYLYYISSDYSPSEKIRLATDMINDIKESQFKKGKKEESVKRPGTAFFKGHFYKKNEDLPDLFSKNVFGYSEENFKNFICTNYDCDTYVGTYETKKGTEDKRIRELMLETEQNTASENYKNLIEELEKHGVSKSDCRYGLWFTDINLFKEQGYKSLCDREGKENIDINKFEDLADIVLGVDKFLKEGISGDFESVTRTSMISAYYYYYNELHKEDYLNEERSISFRDVYSSFEAGINDILINSYYQPLSSKNIFDVIVVFSSYAYLNM